MLTFALSLRPSSFSVHVVETWPELAELLACGSRCPGDGVVNADALWGLDTETTADSSSASNGHAPSTLQLANNAYCVIVPLYYLYKMLGQHSASDQLASFLSSRSVFFVGMGVASDTNSLAKYGLSVSPDRMLDISRLTRHWHAHSGGLEELVYRYTTLFDAFTVTGPHTVLDNDNPEGVGATDNTYPDLAVGWKSNHIMLGSNWDLPPSQWTRQMALYAGIDALASYTLGQTFLSLWKVSKNTIPRAPSANQLYAPWHIRRRVSAIDILREGYDIIYTHMTQEQKITVCPPVEQIGRLVQRIVRKSKIVKSLVPEARPQVAIWIMRALVALDILTLEQPMNSCISFYDNTYHIIWSTPDITVLGAHVVCSSRPIDSMSLLSNVVHKAPSPSNIPPSDLLMFLHRHLPQDKSHKWAVAKIAREIIYSHHILITSVLQSVYENIQVVQRWLIWMLRNNDLVITKDSVDSGIPTTVLLNYDLEIWPDEQSLSPNTVLKLRQPDATDFTLTIGASSQGQAVKKTTTNIAHLNTFHIVPLKRTLAIDKVHLTQSSSQLEICLPFSTISQFLYDYCILSKVASTTQMIDMLTIPSATLTDLVNILQLCILSNKDDHSVWMINKHKAVWLVIEFCSELPKELLDLPQQARACLLTSNLEKYKEWSLQTNTVNVLQLLNSDSNELSPVITLPEIDDNDPLTAVSRQTLRLLITTQLVKSKLISKLLPSLIVLKQPPWCIVPSYYTRFLLAINALRSLIASNDIEFTTFPGAQSTNHNVPMEIEKATLKISSQSLILHHRIIGWSIVCFENLITDLTNEAIRNAYDYLVYVHFPARNVHKAKAKATLLSYLKDTYVYLPARHQIIEYLINTFLASSWLVKCDSMSTLVEFNLESEIMTDKMVCVKSDSTSLLIDEQTLKSHSLLPTYTSGIRAILQQTSDQVKSLNSVLHWLVHFGGEDQATASYPPYIKWTLAEYAVFTLYTLRELDIFMASLDLTLNTDTLLETELEASSEPQHKLLLEQDGKTYSKRCGWKLRKSQK